MVNRYTGEIRINPVAILRNDDFNNDGEIEDIDVVLDEAITINRQISDRLTKLRAYLKKGPFSEAPVFHFADGGYIALVGVADRELLEMKAKGLIDLFDRAGDRDWVKKYGAQFGLVWEDGRAVEI